jgi:hypothetical protein
MSERLTVNLLKTGVPGRDEILGAGLPFDFFDFDKVDGSIEFINLAQKVEQGDFDLVLAHILDAVRVHAAAYVFIDSFRSFIQGAAAGHPHDRLARHHVRDRRVRRQRGRPKPDLHGCRRHHLAQPGGPARRSTARLSMARNW